MNNIEHLDKRLEEQQAKRKEAANNTDEKAFKLAEAEIAALTEMRKFYAGSE